MIELLIVGAVCLTTIVCTSLSVVSAIHKRELEADNPPPPPTQPSPFEEKRRLLEREYELACAGEANLINSNEQIRTCARRRQETHEQLLRLAEEEANWRKRGEGNSKKLVSPHRNSE